MCYNIVFILKTLKRNYYVYNIIILTLLSFIHKLIIIPSTSLKETVFKILRCWKGPLWARGGVGMDEDGGTQGSKLHHGGLL